MNELAWFLFFLALSVYWQRTRILPLLAKAASRRPVDFIIQRDGAAYLLRWYVIPRNKWFNIYFHKVLLSDDEILHDHPWLNMSVLVSGGYFEETQDAARGWKVRWRRAGDFVLRRATTAHRLTLYNNEPAESFFITGPVVRDWGFHCPQGWVLWKDYVKLTPSGNETGPGCN